MENHAFSFYSVCFLIYKHPQNTHIKTFQKVSLKRKKKVKQVEEDTAVEADSAEE